MTDTANTAPDASTPDATSDSAPAVEGTNDQSNTNAQAVADAIADKTGKPGESVSTDFDFVLDKYRAEGRSDSDAAMEQAKAYKELQSKFGAFTGAPEEYEVSLSEEMSERINLEDFKDDPILEEAKAMSKEMGINNEGFNRLTELYFKGQLADTEAIAAAQEDEMKALGPNAQRRLDNLSDWAKHHLDSETTEKLESAMISASAVEAIEAVIAKTRNAVQATDAAPANDISHEKLREMMNAKDDFGNPKMNNKEYARQVDKLYSQKFGDEPRKTIVG